MKYKIEFQYKASDSSRPDDAVQEEELIIEDGRFFPIPLVGDSVSYRDGDQMTARKVVSRHFSYVSDWCAVIIVVSDMSDAELASRLKE